MGGASPRRCDARPKRFGASLRTGAAVARISSTADARPGSCSKTGEEIEADVVVTTTHPKIDVPRSTSSAATCRRTSCAPSSGGRRAAATVKVNLALDRLPEFRCKPGFDPEVHGGTIVLAQSLDDIEGAFQDAVAGRAAGQAIRRHLHPDRVFDPTLAPPGKHVVSMFTQWVPHTWASEPRRGASSSAYADRVIARVEELAPGLHELASCTGR